MNDRQYFKKRVLRAAAICLAVLAIIAAGFFVLRIWETSDEESSQTTPSPEDEGYVMYEGKWYKPKPYVETLLIIGLDKNSDYQLPESYTNDMQSDFLLLVVYDNENKTCTPIHISRDTFSEVQVLGADGSIVKREEQPLAFAHVYGSGGKDSCRNTVTAVSTFLHDVDIGNYASVTMDAVVEINDLAGGVTLEVMDDFGENDPTLKKGETVTLLGEHALNYVRARYGIADETNEHRMVRQRQYMKEFRKQVVAKLNEDADFAMTTLDEVEDSLVSNCSINSLSEFVAKAGEYDFKDFVTFEGDYYQGDKYMELHVDQEKLMKKIIDIFYTEVKH